MKVYLLIKTFEGFTRGWTETSQEAYQKEADALKEGKRWLKEILVEKGVHEDVAEMVANGDHSRSDGFISQFGFEVEPLEVK